MSKSVTDKNVCCVQNKDLCEVIKKYIETLISKESIDNPANANGTIEIVAIGDKSGKNKALQKRNSYYEDGKLKITTYGIKVLFKNFKELTFMQSKNSSSNFLPLNLSTPDENHNVLRFALGQKYFN